MPFCTCNNLDLNVNVNVFKVLDKSSSRSVNIKIGTILYKNYFFDYFNKRYDFSLKKKRNRITETTEKHTAHLVLNEKRMLKKCFRFVEILTFFVVSGK